MRDSTIEAFLSRADWGNSNRLHLAGDASNRRYERIERRGTDETAILMDAPDQGTGSIPPFVQMTELLRDADLSAPEIYAADPEAGLLLLEDLGDGLFSRVLERDRSQEVALYEAAVDALIHVQRIVPPGWVAAFDAVEMAEAVRLTFNWYASSSEPAAQDKTVELIKEALEQTLAAEPPVLMLRDFHAENLLWLPKRVGIARVGLLDYQDARTCHPVYDLVSLLQDARRDVGEAAAAAAMQRFAQKGGFDVEAIAASAAVLGMQRNLRILGVFARLSRRDGKQGYVGLIPRVWAHLMRDLESPELSVLRDRLIKMLPEPSPSFLEAMRHP